jgi:hypothetical protein
LFLTLIKRESQGPVRSHGQQHPVGSTPGSGAWTSQDLDFASTTQQQEVLLLPSIPLMTAAAQPTPARTEIASAGQFCAQAPHSMQASLVAMTAMSLERSKTPWGHTIMQRPHPVHLSGSSLKLATFFR